MLDEFKQWQLDVKSDIDVYTEKLVKEAIKQGNGERAERWLRKNKPELIGDYHASTSDQLNTIVITMFENAIFEVRKIAMKQEIK